MYRDSKGLCWNTGLGSEKSILPSSCRERTFPPGEISASLPAAFLIHTEAALAPAWRCRRLQRGLWPRLSVCWPVSSHEHHDTPLALTLPLLFPSSYTAGAASVFVLADCFFQNTPEMECVPSGPNSIMFCQNLVLEDNWCRKLSSAQSSRRIQFSSQERNLFFPFSSKYLKFFI